MATPQQGRVLRSFEHGAKRRRETAAASEDDGAEHAARGEQPREEAIAAAEGARLGTLARARSRDAAPDNQDCEGDSEGGAQSVASPSTIKGRKRPRPILRRTLPEFEEVLRDLEREPWLSELLQQDAGITEAGSKADRDLREESESPEAVMAKLRVLAPGLVQSRGREQAPQLPNIDEKRLSQRWVKKAAPLELPTLSTLTPRTMKRIERLPRPGPAELARLAEIDETLLQMDPDQDIGHAAREKQSLYAKLWKYAQRRALDMHMPSQIPPGRRYHGTDHLRTGQAAQGLAKQDRKQRERRPRRKRRAQEANTSQEESREPGARVDSLRQRLQGSDGAAEAARARVGNLIKEARAIVPSTALFEQRLRSLMAAASQKDRNKLQRTLTRIVRRYQRVHLLPSWNKWRVAVHDLRREAEDMAARRIQRLAVRAGCGLELQERGHQRLQQRERREAELRHRIERRQRAPQPFQRAFRAHCARKELARRRRLREAAVSVQCAWRARKCRVVLVALQAVKLHRNLSATHVQRVFRGHRARVRAKLLRKINLVAAKERARAAAQAAIESRLVRIGAVALIQGWWRALQRRWLTRAMVMVMKRRAAIRIQSFWRSAWAVQQLKLAIAERHARFLRESAAATTLQKRFRIRCARARVDRIRAEVLEARARREEDRARGMQDRTVSVFGRIVNVTKNRRALHELRGKVNPFAGSRRARAAVRIQRVWRGARARRRVQRRRAQENRVLTKLRRDKVRAAALQLQKRWRGIRERRRLEMLRRDAAAAKIQARYRARLERRKFLGMLERHKAASRVQKRWRGRLARKMMVVYREEVRTQNAAARRCQRAIQRYLFRKGYRERLERERTWFELRQQGAIETILAQRAEGYRLLLHAGFLNNAKGGGELRALFVELAEPQAQLSGEKFAKMAIAAPGLAHLQRNALDLIFAKAKKPDSRLLGYPEFREALIGLATHLFLEKDVEARIKAYKATIQTERAAAKKALAKRPTTTQSPSSKTEANAESGPAKDGAARAADQGPAAMRAQRQAEKDADRKEEARIREEAVAGFTFRRHRGRRGLLLRVLHEHVWRADYAERQRMALASRAEKRMNWAATMVQRRFRGVVSRSLLDRIREQRDREITAERQRIASTKMQSFWRMCRAKMAVRALARRQVQKCIDSETGDPYWFNTQTGASSWTKPKLLGDADAEVSIVMPQKDDEFVVKCARCNTESASVGCLDCADPFCADCHRQEHHDLPTHTSKAIEVCTECTFQAATRRCTTCQRDFCCTCFEIAHFITSPWQDEPMCEQPSQEQATLAKHKWRPLVKVCVECDARAVRWRCEDCGDDFCARCLKDLHRKGNRRVHNFHPLPYLSMELAAREDQMRAKKRALAEKERLKAWRKQAEKESMEKVALMLQARFRGRRDRVVGKAMLRAERLRQRDHWRLVKHDMAERKKINYRLQAAVGIAPILETDDDETKERKRMGWKATPWGRLAVAAGVALPFGDPLPGPVKVHGNEELYIHVVEEWAKFVSADDYIRLDDQYFLVKQVGERDENDPTKPVDAVEMVRAEKRRKREENDPWALDDEGGGEAAKKKKKKKKKKKVDAADGDSNEDAETGSAPVDGGLGAKTVTEKTKRKLLRKAKAAAKKPKGFQACTLQIHLDVAYEGEIPFEVEPYFVGRLNMAQESIIKAKRADTKAISEKLGGRLAEVMARTKDFIAEKADDYVDPDTAARLGKRFGAIARLAGKRRDSIGSIAEEEDDNIEDIIKFAAAGDQQQHVVGEAVKSSEPPLPAGWEEFWDDANGVAYFYNHSTGESVWDRPSR